MTPPEPTLLDDVDRPPLTMSAPPEFSPETRMGMMLILLVSSLSATVLSASPCTRRRHWPCAVPNGMVTPTAPDA